MILLLLLAVVIWIYVKGGVLLGLAATIVYLFFLYDKKYASLCNIIARSKYGKGQTQEAMKYFERSYKKGMNINQRITYSYYLLREGKPQESEDILNRLLAFKLPPNIKNLAKSYHALVLMKTDRSEEALEELLEIFPTFKTTNMYGSIGFLYVQMGKLEEAEKFNLEAYDFNSDDPIILDNLVQLYNQKGEYEKAYSYVEELMQKSPSFIEAYYDAAVCTKALGKTELFNEYVEKAKTIKTTFLSHVTHEDVAKL
ncbi:MAG: hypothetical protein IKB60_04990 [Clostridia bacterium]|nr:hypothetical protein [Clostridia bacterium]